jgi:hypothetical protein
MSETIHCPSEGKEQLRIFGNPKASMSFELMEKFLLYALEE